MNDSPINDTQLSVEICKSIKPIEGDEDNSFELRIEGGGCLWVRNPDKLAPPEPGDKVQFYGKGFGYPVRGVVCKGRCYFYETEMGFKEAQREAAEASDRKARDEFETNLPKWSEDVAALPEPFRDRIVFFMCKPDWGHKFGGYELFTCQEAVKIANHCKTPDAIKEFHDSPWDARKEVVSDEHSGNTFGTACQLAMFYLRTPELLRKAHGALCPLVGCEDYGCWCTTEEAAQERKEHGEDDVHKQESDADN